MRPITNGSLEQFQELNIIAGTVARRVNSHLAASGIVVSRLGFSVWALVFLGPILGVLGIILAWKWGLLTAATLPYALLGLIAYVFLYIGVSAVICAMIDYRVNEQLRMIARDEPQLIATLRQLARKEYAEEQSTSLF